MMEAKNALAACDGDFDKAIDHLRKSGSAKAAKRADRTTSEGLVHCYTHSNQKLGVVVELLCETDFVAKNEIFTELAHNIAMHIAAMSPLYVSREEVPANVIAKEKEIYAEQLSQEGKPADMIEKISEGKLNKFYEEVCLLEQPFIKDEDITIAELIESKIASLGENIKLNRFTRIQIGG